uniref:NADH-ubiquinone oxidoreductase chain 4 n=1 Tax=Phrynoglossus myanhessei TaxID=2798809 RepID=A0A8A0WW77_9NEOB|nr:NADH dehydrogenase subunit 4 [Phrynoglossus myanhessei]QSQ72200.1 NADH dehydrogenase subunit 4 [Phrynoglossus myanhessei]
MTTLTTWAMLILTIGFVPRKHLWNATLCHSTLVAALSINWFYSQLEQATSVLIFLDNVSMILAILTCWLFPLTVLASQSKMQYETIAGQRIYLISLSTLQFLTLLAFTASNLVSFFLYFEASLIPAIILISRWGNQSHRVDAAVYIMFFTMLGAFPLLLWMMKFYITFGLLSPAFSFGLESPKSLMIYPGLFWFAYNMAFLMKLPLYGIHMWLPKAHVEAPIAGSMILAGTLLKLGGYGMLRLSVFIEEYMKSYAGLFLAIAMFGVLGAALLCTRQTDLKSLIAMSSVSHMNLLVVAALIATKWSYSGALVLMITHGLTSSALFCLANTLYERTNTRALIMLRGVITILPLAGVWWMTIALYNMALPPTLNFASELILLISFYYWSKFLLIMVIFTCVYSSAYSLYMYWSVQRGRLPSHLKTFFPFDIREHILLLLHALPGVLLLLNSQLLIIA